MSAQIIDGVKIAAEIKADIKRQAMAYEQRTGRKPGLAVILVGNDFASEIYVTRKMEACEQNNIKSFEYRLPYSTTETELVELITRLNDDADVDGILVQLPLPEHIREMSYCRISR